MTKADELRELTDDVLELRLAEAKDELFKLRFGHATGQLDDTTRLTLARREIARMHTLAARARDRGARSDARGGVMADDAPQPRVEQPARSVRASRCQIKMDKTVVVAVVDRVRHRRYQKTVQRTKHLYAHDETNDVREGDRVRVSETRPLSKLKRWRVVEVLERAR